MVRGRSWPALAGLVLCLRLPSVPGFLLKASVDRTRENEDHGLGERWVYCAAQWQECDCPGSVRWGVRDTWRVLPPQAAPVKCTVDALGDIMPGEDGKHCQCQVRLGSGFSEQLSPGILPENGEEKYLVSSCEKFKSAANGSSWGWNLWKAAQGFCEEYSGPRGYGKAMADSELRNLMDAWVDARSFENYQRLYDEDGWINEAFVNYVGTSPPRGKFARMNEQLIRSVHLFSTRPIIVFHFGTSTPPEWDARRYPRLVVINAPPIPGAASRNFNWNKMRAMLMSRIKTGVQLDSDQFVAPGVDQLFGRTAEEVTAGYPMPILPVHFYSDKGPNMGGKWWHRFCDKDLANCPAQTLRWSHAHPTWTYHALPFVAKWLLLHFRDQVLPAVDGRPGSALRVFDVPQDEDLLNVGTWEEGGTKQWCKFDITDPTEFNDFLRLPGDTSPRVAGDIAADSRFHPAGAARAFFTAHHAVDPEASAKYIARLAERLGNGTLPPPIMFKNNFYPDGESLRRVHPEVRCII